MSGTRAAIRYAKAILSLAVDQKLEETVNNDMKLIANTVSQNSDLDLALKNAIAKQDTKKEILNQVFPKLNPLTSKLFDVLVDNNRIDAVADVARKYNELYDNYIGKEKATVTTAVSMTKDLEIKVMAKIKELTSKSVDLENIVDESIIGGFILRVGDIQYNASIASKLNKLKREFTLN
jgi:F-type H+-transporting ATPase subunit delta